jgi:hypothetical protein
MRLTESIRMKTISSINLVATTRIFSSIFIMVLLAVTAFGQGTAIRSIDGIGTNTTFRPNATPAGRSTAATFIGDQYKVRLDVPFGSSVGIGYGTLSNSTTGQYNSTTNMNVAIGHMAGNQTSTGQVTAVGYYAAANNTSGVVTAFGRYAAVSNSTGHLTAFGNAAGRNNRTSHSAMFGDEAGGENTIGQIAAFGYYAASLTVTNDGVTAIGHQAMRFGSNASATVVGYNAGYENRGTLTAVGYQAGNKNTTGTATAVGHEALFSNTTGAGTGVGYRAGYNNLNASMVAVGYEAGRQNTSGQSTSLGYSAGYKNTTGNLIAVGYNAGYGLTFDFAPQTDVGGILIGWNANRSTGSTNQLTNYVGIGHTVLVDRSNQVKIGNTNTAETLLFGNVFAPSNLTLNAVLTASNVFIAPSNFATVPLSVLNNAGASAFLVDSNGFVGVGTATPTRQLQIRNAGAATMAITAGSASLAEVQLGDSSDNDIGRISYNNGNDSLALYTANTQQQIIDNLGNVTFTTNVTAGGLIQGSYGSAACGTGVVTVATSASTNKFYNWAYTKTRGIIGMQTNATFWVTNAGDYFISFGCRLTGANLDLVKFQVFTNDVHCGILEFNYLVSAAALSETGFKEFAITLPANCRVDMRVANEAASSTTIANACLNVKGGN